MKSDYINDKEFEHILSALMPTNSLIMRLALSTGLRISDILSFETVRFRQRMTIVEQKTGKKKKVYIPKKLYSEVMKQAGKIYVFQSRFDEKKHRTRQAVWKDVKRAAKAFRMNKTVNVCPHSARKNYAVGQFEKTGDLNDVRKKLNHDDETITLIYAMSDLLAARKGQTKKPIKKR